MPAASPSSILPRGGVPGLRGTPRACAANGFGAGLTAFTLFFFESGMPRLWDPSSEIDGIQRVTTDRYWLGIDPGEPAYDPHVVDEMHGLGAVEVRRVEGVP